MSRRRDPIQRVADDASDLYDVTAWEERTRLDRLAGRLYRAAVFSGRAVVVLLAIVILVVQAGLVGVAAVDNPLLGVYILLSVVPALALAAYVRRVDVTSGEPLRLLVGTFMLGFLLAGFAAVFNSALQPGFTALPVVGLGLFFFVVVGPVEETVKWLAVRLFAYRHDEFDAVVDGAVYGAFAGLGFATIENSLYITQEFLNASGTASEALFGVALQTTAIRTFAGPGHVIYSAFAGYYLGLAKFNPDDRGPIVVKGLLIAVFIHALYNSIVTYVPLSTLLSPSGSFVPASLTFIGFVLVYDGVFGYVLYRKLARYRRTYRDLGAAPEPTDVGWDSLPALVEFDPTTGDGPADGPDDHRPTGRSSLAPGQSASGVQSDADARDDGEPTAGDPVDPEAASAPESESDGPPPE